MKKKREMEPWEMRMLAAKAELLPLLRDPANLAAVRRFCEVLRGLGPDKEGKLVFIGAVAGKVFPECAIETEIRKAVEQDRASRQRRARNLVAAGKRPNSARVQQGPEI